MNFDIGLSALRSSQFALSTVAQNLANANTEGYHRQLVSFQTRLPQRFENQFMGSGVDIRLVDRARDQIVESSYTNAISDLRNIEQRLSIESQIESLFLPGQGSLQESLSGLFNELSALSANPTEVVQRNSVVRQGVGLAQQIREVSDQLTGIRTNVSSQIKLEVSALNSELRELVALQRQIGIDSVHSVPNDLLDRRDQLVNIIAEKIDIQRIEHVQGGMGLAIAGHSISIGQIAPQFEASLNDDGSISYVYEGTDHEIQFQSGSLNALQNIHNETIGAFQNRLDEFATGLIRSVDQAHAKGVGSDGPFNVLTGSRGVGDIDAPLESAGLAFPVEAGELYFSVTDSAGERRTHSISIDPTVDSLRDIATRISALSGVRASISSQTNTMSVSASPGFKFDFSGNLETAPDLALFTGTSSPEFSGRYEGAENRSLRVEIIGSGTIGSTPGLMARVYNESGDVIRELDIGDTYEAGSDLAVIDGVELSFSVGSVNGGDEISTALVADSDTTGILSALGLNSFFTGTRAVDIGVATRIVEDPNQLATSKTSDTGDTFNLAELVKLRDDLVMNEDRLTFEDFLGEVVSEIGFQVQSSSSVQQSFSNLKYGYERQLDSVSGVDLNEEMLNMAKFQKAYEASIQVIRTMEAMMDELYNIIR